MLPASGSVQESFADSLVQAVLRSATLHFAQPARLLPAKTASERYRVYAILSGTGLYANATGTGTFESLPSKLEGATILNTKLNVKTP